MLKAKGVLLTMGNWMSVRAVTHLDVAMDEVKQAVNIFHELVL
jgi:hypothetical protein